MMRIPWAGSGCGACGWKTRLIPADIGLGLKGPIFAMQIVLHLVETNIFEKITLDQCKCRAEQRKSVRRQPIDPVMKSSGR
ncbi:hypothetical protein [Sterolibacterium denitrificans]|uniref:hypothetical protein n=1 Tax=Sterolibacterium denitrificans TaxID=157592 RepID=UPI0012B69714|nr:hypothetical protein [Sterolibacterium denitrificans]